MRQQPHNDTGVQQNHSEPSEEYDIRQRLLDSAIKCFGRGGYEETSLESIASDSALEATDILAYWPDKLSLFLDAIDASIAKRATLLVGASALPPEQKLPLLGANLVMPNREEHRGLLLEACEQSKRNLAVRASVQRFFAVERDALASMIEAGQESDVIDRSLNTNSLVVFCLALSLGTHLVASIAEPELPTPKCAEWDRIVVRLMRAAAPTDFSGPDLGL